MSDRRQDSSITLYADLPSTGLTGTVTLTDALGASAAASTAFTEVGQKRYKVTLTLTTTHTIDGLWKAVWNYTTSTYTQQFTMGDGEGNTRWDVRFHAARRISAQVWLGYISESTLDTLTDSALLGDSDEYIGSWVVLNEDEDQFGFVKRVLSYDGSTLTLDSDYASAPTEGNRYLLLPTELRPERIDAALDMSLQPLATRTYVRTQLTGQVPDANGFIAIPDGWYGVTEVWYLDADSIENRLAPTDWICVPGQRIYIPSFDASWTVTVMGLRQARIPLFDDSVMDIPQSVLVPEMAKVLHLDLAGGQATDADAHLQRAAQAFQEHGVQITIALPRLPRDFKRVIP